MNELAEVAPAFVEMAHRIVWCTAATVDSQGRPRSRILHPVWRWDGERLVVGDLFKGGPEPVGYDPAIVPNWVSPTSESFAAIRLDPWRLRVFPGTVLLGQGGQVLTWQERD